MGNCVVMEKKVIKIMRNDGKVVEYRGPMKVHQILTQFSGHFSLFDSLSTTCHLHPQSMLLCGRLYYLIPKETTTPIKPKKTNKKVRFVEKQDEEGCGDNTNEKIVRVKMVVTKQELERLLQGGSVHDLVYTSLAKQHLCSDDVDGSLRGWRPLLDSIPESD